MSHGVRIFRVDNPHTKPLAFWEWLLDEIHRTDPDVLFLAEAFTRPAMMHGLAMAGFHQSYTYFTWRNHADELIEYLQDLSGETAASCGRTSSPTRPTSCTTICSTAGRRRSRFGPFAAMLSPTWGIYSGYELCENVPVRPGSEEYMDSEKYQYRPRDWDLAARENLGIAPYIAALNRFRKSHPALHRLRNLRFHTVDQPDWLAFSKSVTPRRNRAWPARQGTAAQQPHVLRSSTSTRIRPGRRQSGWDCRTGSGLGH